MRKDLGTWEYNQFLGTYCELKVHSTNFEEQG